MKYLAILVAAASLLLSGCATTIRSNVTAFNDWPAAPQDKSYVFETPPTAEDTLEYHSYQVLVSNEMAKLGFRQTNDPASAGLRVGMHFSTTDVPVRVLQANDPFWAGPVWPYSRYGFYRYGYRPFYYDPWRYNAYEVEEVVKHNYERLLRVTINGRDGRKLFDVTVTNSSRVQATPHVMPALVQSAFTGFPGQSGVPRRVDLKIAPQAGDDGAAAPASPSAPVPAA
ncbi:DUF4136 domain-containing protein [Rugamonas rubra]|uniref:DUF4136 domain-containing protein n=1 Tax=Rugamonas rubra TaxID=758825 RepID=A0A1I4I7F9_9BURK|nr:DUF4136 domain-containing protein [Rugamonas rubra]SFL49636.1 protein of unknown function [Rugamonas rubra]